MRAEDPWLRPTRREINPLWIAAVILFVLFVGYRFILSTMPALPTADHPSVPAPTATATRPAVQKRERREEPAPPNPSYDAPLQKPPASREIYLCKAYSGNMFWSTAICSTQRATIDRIVSVPTNVSWEEQVSIAEGARQQAQLLYAPVPTPALQPAGIGRSADTASRRECTLLDERIKSLDALARQPQFGQTQDWLRNERQMARSRQAQLRC